MTRQTEIAARRMVVLTAVLATSQVLFAQSGINAAHVLIGWDNNSAANAFVQPQNPALAGGGVDQSLLLGDVLYGTEESDLMIGRLGVDVLLGGGGDDILLGGTEHFYPDKGDRIFAGPGDDIVIWAPGDGSDYMDGGPGQDILILGLVGEVEDGRTVFRVSDDQQAGNVFVDPATNLPLVNVTGSPGFCTITDRSSSPEAERELGALGLQHLVQFFLREQATSFERGIQNKDNGLRQTMHLKDMEVLVCNSRAGGSMEIYDLTVSPPRPMTLEEVRISPRLRAILR